MSIQSEKVDGYKCRANGDGLTWGQERSENAGKDKRVLGLESRQERRKDSARSSSAYETPGRRAENITNISVCTVCSCNPPVGFTLCSSQHGGSFVLIIGWKLQKLCPQSQCLVLTEVSGSGSPGHGSPKESLQSKSFTICILAMVFWRFPMDDLVIPIKKTPCNSLQNFKKSVSVPLPGF